MAGMGDTKGDFAKTQEVSPRISGVVHEIFEPRDLPNQWAWHSTFRDLNRNMYRTSYTDHISGREIACNSHFPAGYGGHVAPLRHDVLFRNTTFDVDQAAFAGDPARECLPDFGGQLAGVPVHTLSPRGPKRVPDYKAKPEQSLRTPWAVTSPRTFPTYRIHVPLGARKSRGALVAAGVAAVAEERKPSAQETALAAATAALAAQTAAAVEELPKTPEQKQVKVEVPRSPARTPTSFVPATPEKRSPRYLMTTTAQTAFLLNSPRA